MLQRFTALPALAAFALIAGSATSAAAQIGPFAIGVKASTLGLGAEAAARIAGPLVARANYTSFSLDQSTEEDGITYDVTGKLQGAGLYLDFHPTRGMLRLSAGMMFKTPVATMEADNPGTWNIGGETYTSAQVTHLSGEITGKKTAPFLGIGLDKSVFAKGRVAIGFELGAVMWGSPEPTLTPTTSLTGQARANLQASIDEEVAELQASVDDAPTGGKYFPVLGFSLKIRI